MSTKIVIPILPITPEIVRWISQADLDILYEISESASGLQEQINSKQPSGSYADSIHDHEISNVNGLQLELDSKQPSGSYADSIHDHEISNVNGLQLELDSKQPSGSYADSIHGHSASSINQDISNRFVSDNQIKTWTDETYPYSMVRDSVDDNGIFTVLTYKRADNSILKMSTLSGGTSPEYTTRTVQFYATDGITILNTVVYTLIYSNSELISETIL